METSNRVGDDVPVDDDEDCMMALPPCAIWKGAAVIEPDPVDAAEFSAKMFSRLKFVATTLWKPVKFRVIEKDPTSILSPANIFTFVVEKLFNKKMDCDDDNDFESEEEIANNEM